MKSLVGIIWLILLTAVFAAAGAQASEGRFTLRKNSVACEGISIWQNGQYRITGRCQGLVYPYAEQLTKYFLWVNPTDTAPAIVRVDDVEGGIIEGRTSERFARLLLTAEGERVGQEPVGAEIISGEMERFDFPSQTADAALSAPVASQPVVTQTPTPTPTPRARTFNAAGLGRAVPVIVIIVVVLVVIAFFAMIFRRG